MTDPASLQFGQAERENAETLIDLALREDLGPTCSIQSDVTSISTIPADARGAAAIRSRASGVVSGLPILSMLAARFDLDCEILASDGDALEPTTEIARISGSMIAMLVMERTALNFLQRLSGVASLTRRFVEAVEGTKARILDTRKTTPGWRALEKYAVRCGGGQNHRMGLYDAVLIKDNHLAWLSGVDDPIRVAVSGARNDAPQARFLEIEVDTLDQLDCALQALPDIVLVDNLGADNLREAVRRRDRLAPGVLLEASGGVTLATVRALAESGVDRISVGALTHSAAALDLGLDFLESRRA